MHNEQYENNSRRKFYEVLPIVKNADNMNNYSSSQVASIMVCTNLSLEDSKKLCDYMDANNDHPDWSEVTWEEMTQHFRELAYETLQKL